MQDDEDEVTCPRCGTEMSPTPNHRFWHCDVCGYNEPIESEEP